MIVQPEIVRCARIKKN